MQSRTQVDAWTEYPDRRSASPAPDRVRCALCECGIPPDRRSAVPRACPHPDHPVNVAWRPVSLAIVRTVQRGSLPTGRESLIDPVNRSPHPFAGWSTEVIAAGPFSVPQVAARISLWPAVSPRGRIRWKTRPNHLTCCNIPIYLNMQEEAVLAADQPYERGCCWPVRTPVGRGVRISPAVPGRSCPIDMLAGGRASLGQQDQKDCRVKLG